MKMRRLTAMVLGMGLLVGSAFALGAGDRAAGSRADELKRGLAESAPDGAVELQIWRSPAAVRERLAGLLDAAGDPTRPRSVSLEGYQRGLTSGWARAQAGLDDERIRQSLRLLRVQWFSGSDSQVLLSQDGRASYTLLARRLADPAAIRQEVEALRELLGSTQTPLATRELLLLYADVAEQLDDPAGLRQAEQLLRERLKTIGRGDPMQYVLLAHARLLARLDDSRLHAEALSRFRERMADGVDRAMARRVADAYLTVAEVVTDPALIRQESGKLRDLLARDCSWEWIERFGWSHRMLAAKQTDPSELAQELASLRSLLQRCTELGPVMNLVQSYVKVAESLSDPAQIRQEVDALHKLRTGEADARKAAVLAWAHVSLLQRQADPDAIANAATEMREQLDRRFVSYLAAAYATLITESADAKAQTQLAEELHERMQRARSSADLWESQGTLLKLAERLDQTVIARTAAMLRTRLITAHELGLDDSLAWGLAVTYGRLVGRLTESARIAEEVAALRERLAFEVDEQTDQHVLRAYADVSARLDDAGALRQAAKLLRERPLRDPGGSFGFSRPSYFAGLVPAGLEPELPSSPHARVLAKLTEPVIVGEELDALRAVLLGERDPQQAHTLVQAYAALAGTALAEHQRRGDREALGAEVRQLLVLAGHPFVADVAPLLAALEPVAGQRFGSRVGAAVAWWRAEFNGDPASLWPGAEP